MRQCVPPTEGRRAQNSQPGPSSSSSGTPEESSKRGTPGSVGAQQVAVSPLQNSTGPEAGVCKEALLLTDYSLQPDKDPPQGYASRASGVKGK